MRNSTCWTGPAAAIPALAGQLFAGGFYLQAGKPEASPEARKLNAAVTIQAAGRHDPALASVRRLPWTHS